MAENQIYTDPILRKYVETITAATPVFRTIFYGNPERVAASQLPALIIQKVDTEAQDHSNVEDQHSIRISFTVITDVRDTISDETTMVKGENSLYDIMEGRQDSDYTLKPTSLLYILRHNQNLDLAHNLRTDLKTITRIDFGRTENRRQPGAWSIEGRIEITANFIQLI